MAHFNDLHQMDCGTFRQHWKGLLRRQKQNPGSVLPRFILIDLYECDPFDSESGVAVAEAQTINDALYARQWWEDETDGECDVLIFEWNADDRRFERRKS